MKIRRLNSFVLTLLITEKERDLGNSKNTHFLKSVKSWKNDLKFIENEESAFLLKEIESFKMGEK